MAENASRQGDHPVVGTDRPVHKVPPHERFEAGYPPCEKDETVEANYSETGELGGRGMEVCLGEADVDAGDGYFERLWPVADVLDEAVQAVL